MRSAEVIPWLLRIDVPTRAASAPSPTTERPGATPTVPITASVTAPIKRTSRTSADAATRPARPDEVHPQPRETGGPEHDLSLRGRESDARDQVLPFLILLQVSGVAPPSAPILPLRADFYVDEELTYAVRPPPPTPRPWDLPAGASYLTARVPTLGPIAPTHDLGGLFFSLGAIFDIGEQDQERTVDDHLGKRRCFREIDDDDRLAGERVCRSKRRKPARSLSRGGGRAR